jgi:hypothetical protein
MVKGKIEEREDKLSLLIDSVDPVSDGDSFPAETAQKDNKNLIIIPKGTTKAILLQLNTLLQSNKGNDRITLLFQNGASGNREIALPFGINFTESMQSQIKAMLTIQPIQE